MPANLLHNLPSFFDRDPEPVLALRVESPQGFQGQVSQGVLTWQDGQQGAVQAISLQGLTLAQLAQRLTAYNGLTVPFLSAEYRDCPAMRLVPDIAYRDGFYVSTSILWAHLQALGQAIGAAESALAAMLRQLVIPQAREEWADAWGFRLGMPRQTGESDADYTQRMIDELYRWRSNPVAMRNNVKRYTGADIELFEPWTRMWTLSQSTLSGGADHFPSGDYYAYHWLHPVARRPGVNWAAVLPVLQADRPAGTLLIDPSEQWDPAEIDARAVSTGNPEWAREDLDSRRVSVLNCKMLSENLSLSAHCVVWNNPFLVWSAVTSSAERSATPLAAWTWRTACKGEIVLSEAPPLGALQGHFPGFEWIETGSPSALSGDTALSDGAWKRERRPIDEWLDRNDAAHLDLSSVTGELLASRAALHSTEWTGPESPTAEQALESAYSTLLFAYPPATWSGIWSDEPWTLSQPGPWPSMTYSSFAAP